MSARPKAKARRGSSSSSACSTASARGTEILINVYDLLPPGRLSSALWLVGSSLLHSGVVIQDREYAYGGHDYRGVSGVYWTPPRTEPPGATFKTELLHGFTLGTDDEIDSIIQEVSNEFLGPGYSLLQKNCNHFTSALCFRLTAKPAPSWLNRAANIGIALPCVVPREWVAPPDHDTADGQLLEDEDDNEHSVMLRRRDSAQRPHELPEGSRHSGQTWDTAETTLPDSERAPPPAPL
ncbi:MAG: hypothetical protein M1815_001551 [Lichina confinis]|nr:MAG: hypothetical protein M1815_001551 [Lichina confinis]